MCTIAPGNATFPIQSINAWDLEEKLQRMETMHHNKLRSLQEAKDNEMAEMARKHEEKVRTLAHEKALAEEVCKAPGFTSGNVLRANNKRSGVGCTESKSSSG